MERLATLHPHPRRMATAGSRGLAGTVEITGKLSKGNSYLSTQT